MTDLTNHGENLAAAACDGALYAALHVGDPGETGASNELSGDGYTREAVTLTTTASVASSTGDVTFGPVTADKGTVTHGSIWDALSGGNCIAKGPLAASFAWPNGTYTISAGEITLTFA